MIPELVYTMLACARIGAVHSIVVSTIMTMHHMQQFYKTEKSFFFPVQKNFKLGYSSFFQILHRTRLQHSLISYVPSAWCIFADCQDVGCWFLLLWFPQENIVWTRAAASLSADCPAPVVYQLSSTWTQHQQHLHVVYRSDSCWLFPVWEGTRVTAILQASQHSFRYLTLLFHAKVSSSA